MGAAFGRQGTSAPHGRHGLTPGLASEVAKRGRRTQNAGVMPRIRSSGPERKMSSRARGGLLALAGALAFVTNTAGQSAGIETLPVRGQVSMLTDGNSNVLAQIGTQGVLLVDTLAAPSATPLIEAVRRAAGRRPI